MWGSFEDLRPFDWDVLKGLRGSVEDIGEGAVSLTVIELDEYTESVLSDVEMGLSSALRRAFVVSWTFVYSK
jgi:hypothetical protein